MQKILLVCSAIRHVDWIDLISINGYWQLTLTKKRSNFLYGVGFSPNNSNTHTSGIPSFWTFHNMRTIRRRAPMDALNVIVAVSISRRFATTDAHAFFFTLKAVLGQGVSRQTKPPTERATLRFCSVEVEAPMIRSRFICAARLISVHCYWLPLQANSWRRKRDAVRQNLQKLLIIQRCK